MRDLIICFVCICFLLFAAACWLSVGSAIQWNAEADSVLQNGLNATGIIESAKPSESTSPVLNPGKPALACPECANYVLTDYRRSPSVFGPNGLYKGHFKGDDFIFDTPPTMENLFSKKPPRRNQ